MTTKLIPPPQKNTHLLEYPFQNCCTVSIDKKILNKLWAVNLQSFTGNDYLKSQTIGLMLYNVCVSKACNNCFAIKNSVKLKEYSV